MHKKEHHKKDNNNPFSEEKEIKDQQTAEDQSQESAQAQAQEVADKATNEESDEFKKVKDDLENLNNQYIRLAADFDNYRKRQSQEREALLKYGTEEALKKLIEVLDNFERAQKSIDSVEDCTTLKGTVDILHKQTIESLKKLGLEEIPTVGEKFDPNFHEAVMQTQSDEYPEETIVRELQKGYKIADKVLRAALVDVAV